MDVDKTRTYIQRSQSTPLEIYLGKDQRSSYLDDAVSLVIPHIHRLKSLTIQADIIPGVLSDFHCPAPLLETLDINLSGRLAPVLDGALFGGDLSSLRELYLGRDITYIPWKNLANLRVFSLISSPPGHEVTQLLDFFESAPLLHTISLMDSIPKASDAPPERIVPLRHLTTLTILADSPHYVLLNHLSIPTGVSLTLVFSYDGEESPLLGYLPERSPNLGNLTHITAVNLCFRWLQKFIRLSGPSGSLRLLADTIDERTESSTVDPRILHSLGPSILSTTQKLTMSEYECPNRDEDEECPVFRVLSSANGLRTLTLIQCNNLPFIQALDPKENPSELMLCPNLEKFVIYKSPRHYYYTERLLNMVKNRACREARLSSIVIADFVPSYEVSKLEEFVGHMEYTIDGEPPEWDYLPGENDSESNLA